MIARRHAQAADLRKSTLTDETIRAQFIRSVPPSMIGRLSRWTRAQLEDFVRRQGQP